MLVALGLSMVLASGSPAVCMPDASTMDRHDEIHQQMMLCRFQADPDDCRRSLRRQVDNLLDEQPASIHLHRLRQDMVLLSASPPDDTETNSMIERYRANASLPDSLRDYLVARLQRDVEGLEQASDNGIAWAQLDRIARTGAREPLLTGEKAAASLRDFWQRCPDAGEWLFAHSQYFRPDLAPEVFVEARRGLLARQDPPWDLLMDRPLTLGLQLPEDPDDPVGAMAAELDLVLPEAQESAGFWLYQARLYQLVQNPDAALEANQRALAIDPCARQSPMEDPQAEAIADPDSVAARSFFSRIDREVIDCEPAFHRYQFWLWQAEHFPEQASAEALARIRDRSPFEPAYSDASLAWSLAFRDIRVQYRPESAWAEVESQIAAQRERALPDDSTEPSFHWLTHYWMKLGAAARLAWQQDETERGKRWLNQLQAETTEHRPRRSGASPFEEILSHLDASISELRYFEARQQGDMRTAVEHALAARQQGLRWVDLDALRAEWLSAGNSGPAFDALLDKHQLAGVRQYGWEATDVELDDFTIEDLDGVKWQLTELSGQRVLINIWATWCSPCLKELPLVQDVWEHYQDEQSVQILTVNIDHDPGLAKHLIEREGFDFPVLMTGSEHEMFGRMILPRSWLVDSNGHQRWSHSGFSPAIVDGWVDQVIELIESVE